MEQSKRSYAGYVIAGVAVLGIIGGVVYLNRPVALPEASPLPAPPQAGAGATTPAAPTQTPTATPAANPSPTNLNDPPVNPTALKGLGDLAFLWKGQPYIMDGETGSLTVWTDSGQAISPAWSHDGEWLAYIRVTNTESISGPLWVVRRDGFGAHQVQGLPESVHPGDFHWSPTAETLAVRSGGLWLVPVEGTPEQLDPAPGLQTFAWSPDGKQIAYNATLPTNDMPNRSDVLNTIDVDGGKPVSHLTAEQAGVVVAAWAPDSASVLFWKQPIHSASLAADGMSLYSLKLGEKEPKLLTSGLAGHGWLSLSPTGKMVMVAGGGRTVWAGKHLDVCDTATVTCKSLPNPQGSVALDPAITADGSRIAFVGARELAPEVYGMKPEQVTDWVKSRQLYVEKADGSGLQALTAAGTGVYNPIWSKDGSHILYWQENALWVIAADGAQATRVAGPFPDQTDVFGFYGYVSFKDRFDWFQK